MSGHNRWSKIKHKKEASDSKKSKVWTKVIKELTLSARLGGGDIAGNPRLRAAADKARSVNMPNDTIDRAIKKGTGDLEGVNYEEFNYEVFGPGGAAVLVEIMTDNRNRTASDIRAAFTKSSGQLGETNSVSFMFDRVGEIVYPAVTASADGMLDAGIEAGASDVESDDERHVVLSGLDDFNEVRDALEQRFGAALSARLVWRPKTASPVDEETAASLFKLLESLEDSDDVQNVYANFEVAEDIMARLSA